jgi:glycosyltransferase involved in cell wall biosynthesis
LSQRSSRTKILAVTDGYPPGFKGGGPIHSVSNLVTALGGQEFDFAVLTRDRDHTDTVPYNGVTPDTWVQVGNAHVMYTADLSFANLRHRIAETKPDIIYLNSFFSRFTIRILLLRRLGMLLPATVVLAPRGEFSPGALALQKTKKVIFMKLAARMGLYRNLLWQASAQMEKEEIREVISSFRLSIVGKLDLASRIYTASDIPSDVPVATSFPEVVEKHSGQVSFVLVSRVSPMKNLAFAIEMVSSLKGDIVFDIYGPVDDQKYWDECWKLTGRTPENVKIRYLGALQHNEVRKKFSQYHFFLFPTLGENFGHVIVEALSVGCPVIVSDQTPWSHLQQKNIGWDLPLADRLLWHTVLQHCTDMDAETYVKMSNAASGFMQEWLHSPTIREDNINLFRSAISGAGDFKNAR